MTAVASIGVVGAGAMGRGIAELAARSGFAVRLHDAADGAVARAIAAIGDGVGREVAKGRLDAAEAAAIRGGIAAATLAEVAQADLVIEAIVEDLDAKQALFRAVDGHARPDAILATNTSSLSVAKIAEAAARPRPLRRAPLLQPADPHARRRDRARSDDERWDRRCAPGRGGEARPAGLPRR